MLVVKNKTVSLRWEMNSILMQILQKNFFCIDHQHGRRHVVANEELACPQWHAHDLADKRRVEERTLKNL